MNERRRSDTRRAVGAKAVKKAAVKKSAVKKTAAKKVAAKKAPSKKTKSAPVWIRHYCQGLGDCHLLRFVKDDGTFWHLLIDCGIHGSVKGGSEIMLHDFASGAASCCEASGVVFLPPPPHATRDMTRRIRERA